MEINTKKTKVMVAAKQKIDVTIACNGVALEQVDTFRYLGALITETGDGSKEVVTRLGMARTTIKSITCFWEDRSLTSQIKRRLMETLIWPVATYACETWTQKAADQKRITAFEMCAYRRLLRISWKDHRTNQSILDELQPNRRLFDEVKRQKLQYSGHIARAQGLPTSVLHGYNDGSRSRGRPRRGRTDDIKDWTRMSVPACCSQAQDRRAWRSLVSSCLVSDPQSRGWTKRERQSCKFTITY